MVANRLKSLSRGRQEESTKISTNANSKRTTTLLRPACYRQYQYWYKLLTPFLESCSALNSRKASSPVAAVSLSASQTALLFDAGLPVLFSLLSSRNFRTGGRRWRQTESLNFEQPQHGKSSIKLEQCSKDCLNIYYVGWTIQATI